MSRPLFSPLATEVLGRNKGNTGLWYDKFCNQWCRDPSKSDLDAWTLAAFKNQYTQGNPKLDWIDSVCDKVGEAGELVETNDRISALLRAHGRKPLPFKAVGPFVSGLGHGHPVENGFAWHHSLGVPYLPGSSVKGMVRAWAECWLADPVSKEAAARICGAGVVGTVIFLDALPIGPVKLKADVMTPHYTPYYQERKPPADWYSPIPVPFLVVDSGATFLFGLLPRNAGAVSDCDIAEQWMADALREIGAGAKTAVGYGRFERPDLPSGNGVHGTAASAAKEPQAPMDPLTEFQNWFIGCGIGARTKGLHEQVVSRMRSLPDLSATKAWVRSRMKKGDCTASLWQFLNE